MGLLIPKVNSTNQWIYTKRVVFLALLLPSVALSEATDKVAHAGVGLAASLATYGILKQQGVPKVPAALIGSLAGASLGILKELSDPRFDVKDLAATAGGAFLGTGMVFMFEF